MKKISLALLLLSLITLPSYSFSLKDIKKELGPDMEKCEKADKKSKCKDKERLKSAAKIIAVSVAAKLVYDMVVDYQSKKVEAQDEVISRYLKEHRKLPKQPQIVKYESSITPGQVITLGKKTMVKSLLEIVPAKKPKKSRIEEQIEIFDIEGDAQVITTMRKPITQDEEIGGTYDNQFAFTFPEGMPQGVYKVKTAVFVDKKEQKESRKEFQVVMLPQLDTLYIAAQL